MYCTQLARPALAHSTSVHEPVPWRCRRTPDYCIHCSAHVCAYPSALLSENVGGRRSGHCVTAWWRRCSILHRAGIRAKRIMQVRRGEYQPPASDWGEPGFKLGAVCWVQHPSDGRPQDNSTHATLEVGGTVGSLCSRHMRLVQRL